MGGTLLWKFLFVVQLRVPWGTNTVSEGGDTHTWNKEYGAIYPQLLRQKPVQPLEEIHPLAHSIQTLTVWPHLLSEGGD